MRTDIQPEKRTFWEVEIDGKKVRSFTDYGQKTSTEQPITFSENADEIYPALPDVGTQLEEGEIYSYNGGMVEVRQSHVRTNFEPEETPALFSVYRANTDGAEWIPNEDVIAGDERTFSNKKWTCIQQHTTQLGFEPDVTPALWREVQIENEIEVWVQPIGGDGKYPLNDPNTGENYIVSHNGKTWRNIHQGSLNVWEPGVFGWEEIV